MWQDVVDTCLLCEEIMEPSKCRIVNERGIKNLIEASIKRNDKKHLKLRDLTEITVHKTCQTMYVRESNIKIAVAKSKQNWYNVRSRAKSGREFDFSATCFLCSNPMHDVLRNCHRITKQSTIDNLIAQLEVYPKTEENMIISSRLAQLKSQDDNYYSVNNISYHSACLSKFYQYSPCNVRGRPISEDMSDVLSFIINDILENSDECQFSLKSILEKYASIHGNNAIPRLDRIEKLLQEHFGDEIIFETVRNDRLLLFKRTLGKCINDKWYESRKSNDKEERLRIVDLAAHIILQDVRSMAYNTNEYNSPTDFLNNANADIPETLKLFLDILIKTHKHVPKSKSWAKWDNRITTAAHTLISSVRPRSFSSSILLGLSCMMHSKFAARGLIDCLYNLGLCASYPETIRFENSIVNDTENFKFVSDTYLQFVYDNADHNTGYDGKNTFHCMGGIMCVTPSSAVSFTKSIPRLKGVLSANDSGTFGFLPLTDFKNNKPFKLDSIIMRDWKEVLDIDFKLQIESIDILYFYGKHTAPTKTANWHGFMNKFHTLNTNFCTTKIIALPFIKAPASEHTTILTALIDARQRANKNNQKHCFVTFDLPLYMKACEIIASIDSVNDSHNLSSVIPRLGGFHLAMSFLGSIGNIMVGSGLKEAFCTIYADLSAEKALTGHAFSRAVRGHFLIQASLATLIFAKIELTDDEKNVLNEILQKVGEENFTDTLNNPFIKSMREKFLTAIENVESFGPTSKLWIQYFKLISLFQRYIDAERSGNFDLHLQTVKLMIPFFFASGHYLYAKAALLYVQSMFDLKEKMDIVEYDKFCNKGFCTMRRSNRFWSGIWSDMTIEQVLMRAMKCSGGLTHGRGLTENVIGKWILSRVAVLEVGNTMETFCNVTFATSEQHVDNRVSRISRDAQDLAKVQQFFETFNPFPEADKIIGIYSGVVGDSSSVNCHNAFEIGKVLMADVSNKKFTDLKFKRSSKIVHLASANSTIKNIANEEVYISPLLIFQKLSLNIENQNDMKEYSSSYELSPIPLALFDENGMRKTTKSSFYTNFECSHEIETEETVTHVVDGGFFLHKVVWQANMSIENIVNRYVSYAVNNYAKNSWIIFDGYPDNEILSTKSLERSRRQLKNIGREIAFDKNTTIIVNQKQFLSNEKNKSRLIQMISHSLNEAGFRTKIAPEDADKLIVDTAIENVRADSKTTVIIVGEDVDLLVIFSQLAKDIENIYFRKENKGCNPYEFYNSSSFKSENLQNIVAFLHAFTGCDTTSCFYRMGKNKLIDRVPHDKLIELASVFYNKNASCDEIASSTYNLIVELYTNKAEKQLIEKSGSMSLNDLRYLHFSKAKIKTKFSLESLPPTEGAAKQHGYRVFYQLQNWLGNTDLQAIDWGWQIKQDRLVPIGSTDPPIPRKLLEQISCGCSKKGCVDASCSCKKHGLKCTTLCAYCNDDCCSNLEITHCSVESEDESVSDDENNDSDNCMNIENDNDSEDEDDTSSHPKRRRLL